MLFYPGQARMPGHRSTHSNAGQTAEMISPLTRPTCGNGPFDHADDAVDVAASQKRPGGQATSVWPQSHLLDVVEAV